MNFGERPQGHGFDVCGVSVTFCCVPYAATLVAVDLRLYKLPDISGVSSDRKYDLR